MLAADLVRWFQLLCFEGYWQSARPKALRWGIFHAPGRIVSSARRRIVRILDGWPSAEAILGCLPTPRAHHLSEPEPVPSPSG